MRFTHAHKKKIALEPARRDGAARLPHRRVGGVPQGRAAHVHVVRRLLEDGRRRRGPGPGLPPVQPGAAAPAGRCGLERRQLGGRPEGQRGRRHRVHVDQRRGGLTKTVAEVQAPGDARGVVSRSFATRVSVERSFRLASASGSAERVRAWACGSEVRTVLVRCATRA